MSSSYASKCLFPFSTGQRKPVARRCIHHRVDISDGAHTWNLFRDAKDGKLYSLDSLWGYVLSLGNLKPGALNNLYRDPEVEHEIYKRHREAIIKVAAKPREPEAVVGEKHPIDKPVEESRCQRTHRQNQSIHRVPTIYCRKFIRFFPGRERYYPYRR